MHRPLTIRLTDDEAVCFQQAPRLLGTGLSQVVQAAVTEAALKLGFDSGSDVPSPPAVPWPDAPERSGSTTRRVTISLDALTAGLLQRASHHVEQPPPRFIVGATLRYLANLARKDNTQGQLATLPFPAKYRTPRSQVR